MACMYSCYGLYELLLGNQINDTVDIFKIIWFKKSEICLTIPNMFITVLFVCVQFSRSTKPQTIQPNFALANKALQTMHLPGNACLIVKKVGMAV